MTFLEDKFINFFKNVFSILDNRSISCCQMMYLHYEEIVEDLSMCKVILEYCIAVEIAF